MVKDKAPLSMEVDELLRKLYEAGVDWLVVESGGDRWFVHKDRLISFIGMGLGESSIVSVLKERKSASKARSDDVPLGKAVFLNEKGLGFFEFDRPEDRPVWWKVPMPLVCISGEKIDLNPKAEEVLGDFKISKKDRAIVIKKGEHLITSRNRRIFLSRLEGAFFVAEDVSCDFSVAEDVGWWASVGKALWERLVDKGFKVIKRDHMDQIDNRSEMITCRWDKEVIGYLELTEPLDTSRRRTGRTDKP